MTYILLSIISIHILSLLGIYQYLKPLTYIITSNQQPHIFNKLQHNSNYIQNIDDITNTHFKWLLIWSPITIFSILLCSLSLLNIPIHPAFLIFFITSSITPIITFKKLTIIKPTIIIINTTVNLIKLELTNKQLIKFQHILQQIHNKSLILPDHEINNIIQHTQFLNLTSKQLTTILKS